MKELLIANYLTVIFALFLWVIVFSFLESYWDDLARQKLFSLRDELFDLASDGKLKFDSPAYMDLRLTINGSIRFVHKLRVNRLVFLIFALKVSGVRQELEEYNQIVKKDFQGLSKNQKELIGAIKLRMALIIVSHLIRTSFFLTPVVTIAIIVFTFINVFRINVAMTFLWSIISNIDSFVAKKFITTRAYNLANAEMYKLGKELATV